MGGILLLTSSGFHHTIPHHTTKKNKQHTHGEDERLKNYLRTNKLSANLLTDESDVIMLTGAKV